MTLGEALKDQARMNALIADCEVFLDSEVRSKRGLSGMAVKGGFKAIKKVRPDIIPAALRMLLPEFITELESFYAEGKDKGDIRGHITANASAVAEGLLRVTDRKAQGAENRVLIKAYKALRPSAKEHVLAGIPGLARIVEKHAV